MAEEETTLTVDDDNSPPLVVPPIALVDVVTGAIDDDDVSVGVASVFVSVAVLLLDDVSVSDVAPDCVVGVGVPVGVVVVGVVNVDDEPVAVVVDVVGDVGVVAFVVVVVVDGVVPLHVRTNNVDVGVSAIQEIREQRKLIEQRSESVARRECYQAGQATMAQCPNLCEMKANKTE